MTNNNSETDILRKAYEHVRYELEMLKETARYLEPRQDLTTHIDRAVYESFVIHARNLLDFFYGKSNNKDNILAEHYISETWRDKRPEKSELLKSSHLRAHKEVAHLTYTRLKVKNEDRPWPVAEITREISEVYEAFLRLAPEDLPRLTPVLSAPPNVVVSVQRVAWMQQHE